tara:strand:+ start:10355 stop:10750 length:396 start_codon:yes stop_codon:yes gene_type:complete
MNILEVIDKLKELDYDEVTIDAPEFKLSLKRNGSPIVSSQAPQATRVIDTIVNEDKPAGLASTKQVKYVRDVMMKEFENNDEPMINYLAHLLELPVFEVPHPDSWDETLTIEMAEAILNDYERRNNIEKKR